MVSIISCGTLEKKIVFPILAGISTFICRILFNIILTEKSLVICIISPLSMCLAFIPLIIIKMKYPKIFKEYNYLIDNNSLIKYYKKDIRIGILLIFLSSILDYVNTIVNFYFSSVISFTNNWAIDILIIGLFCQYSLKIELKRHQIFCYIIIIISGFSLNIIDFYNKFNDIIIPEIICVILKEISFSLKICINRYTMEKHHMSPYEICFYEGLFQLMFFIFTIVGFSIYYNDYIFQIIFDYHDKLIKNNLEISISFILIAIAIILNFLFNLFTFITVKYYHPSYIINIFIIQEIGSNLLDKNKELYKDIITIIDSFIFIITFLIFNEIIEINCLGLSKYTKKNIFIRGQGESITSREESDKDLYGYENDDDIRNYFGRSMSGIEFASIM